MPLPLNAMTTASRRILVMAGDKAERAGQHYIGTEHLLWALAASREGIAGQVLDALMARTPAEDRADQIISQLGPSDLVATNPHDQATIVLGPGDTFNHPLLISASSEGMQGGGG